MKNVFPTKTMSAAVVAGIALLASCSKSNDSSPLTSSDSQNVNSESVSASYTDETSDMGNSVMAGASNSKLNSGSRIADHGIIKGELFDARLKGANITIAQSNSSTTENPSGVITIDFGAGQTVAGVTRSGKIYITYYGLKWANGSYRSLTYSNYRRNGIRIEGTLTDTNTSDSTSVSSPITYTHVLENGKITFLDSTTVTRTSSFTVSLNFSTWTISYSGSAGGLTRDNKEYATVIESNTPLVYKASCIASGVYIPVSGTKVITVANGNAATIYSIDYGTGSCDNTVAITINGGKTITVTANSSGN